MILDLIKKSRTYRHFSKFLVKEEEVLEMLEGARFSGAATNKQNLRFSYTTNLEKCENIFKNISLGGSLKNTEKPTVEEMPKGCIAIIVENNIPRDNYLFFNMGIATQNIILVANELGINCCTVMAFNRKEINKIFSVPENFSVETLIVLGKGKEKIEILDIHSNEDSKYFRKNGIHYVPKIILKDLILKK